MFRIIDIEDEARKIIGQCDDAKFYRWTSDAVQLIAQKGDFEGWKGYVDLCVTDSSCITTPREVETVLSVNIGGHPALGVSQVYNFHLNGPGDLWRPCGWIWQDSGRFHSTYRDLSAPAKLVAYASSAEDNGRSMVIFGFDKNGHRLRRTEGTKELDGYKIILQYGYAVPEASAPEIARITGIFKDETKGPVRLSTTDSDGIYGTVLGVYEPDETLPQYRRIKLIGQRANHVRIAYKKITRIFSSRYDHIELNSRLGFLFAIRALKKYSEEDVGMAHVYEADAIRVELEAQSSLEAPVHHPIQVVDMNNPQDKTDFDIR